MSKIIFLLILFISLTIIKGQKIQDNFVHFTEADGLPASNVTTIMQDHLGYLWFGTHNGLSRYEGNEFYNYSVVNDTNNFLQLPVITALYEDSQGIIWIGAVGGITEYNRDQETFKLYNSSESVRMSDFQVNDIEEISDGEIIFTMSLYYNFSSKSGLFTLDRKSNLITPVDIIDDDSTGGLIQISKINEHEYLISGHRGFGKYNRKMNEINWFPFPEETIVISFVQDENNIFWLGTFNKGLIRYNLQDSTYLSFPLIKNIDFDNDYFIIGKIIFDQNSNLLLASNHGLIHFDCNSYKYSVKKSNIQNQTSLHTNSLNYIYEDNTGSIWISTFDKGISKYNLVENKFQAYTHNPNDPNQVSGWILDFFEYNENEIWLNSGSNITTIIHSDLEKVEQITTPPYEAIMRDSEDIIWIVGRDGAFQFDRQRRKFFDLNIPIDLSNNGFTGVLEDSRRTIWLSSYRGVYTYDRKSNSVANIDFASLGIGTELSLQVIRMVEDLSGNIWFGTEDGLFKYDFIDMQYSRIGKNSNSALSLLSQNVNALYADKFGKIWIGTWLGGLNSHDPSTGEIESFNKNQGLNSHSVQAILGDEENGALWVSTFNGISRFDLEKKTFSNFGIEDGLQSSQFADGSKLKTSRGEFLFGGSNGFTIFKPEDIQSNIVPPNVVITDFKLFNKSVRPGENSILVNPIYKTEKIVLNYDENDIAFDYFAVHYVNPSKNQYAYKLENYEDDWRYVGSQQTAIYPNLPPGEYKFQLKASNNNEVWNEEYASVKIEILPPWWSTRWAYALYILIALGLLYSIRRFEINRQKKNAKLKESHLRAETAELQARAIQAENDRKTKELEEARTLQLSMLPKEIPSLPHLDIAVYMKTATEVGGDYYDFHIALDGTLTVALGDATGHGMKAGTMVTTTKSLFNVLAPNPNIKETFHEMTRCLKQMHLEKLAMCMTMLKISGNKLQMSSAGMPPVYLYRKGKSSVEEHVFKGMPLGTMANFPYSIEHTDLVDGDTVLLMSDGFPELMNNENEMFGFRRTRNLFEDIADKNPEEIITELKNRGSEWIDGNDPDDDVTFVVMKVK